MYSFILFFLYFIPSKVLNRSTRPVAIITFMLFIFFMFVCVFGVCCRLNHWKMEQDMKQCRRMRILHGRLRTNLRNNHKFPSTKYSPFVLGMAETLVFFMFCIFFIYFRTFLLFRFVVLCK